MEDEGSRFFRTKPEGVTVRGAMLTLCLSFGIFAVSIGASRFFFPPSTALNTRLSPGELNEVEGPSGPTEVQESTGYSTSQCAGDSELPVMNGADLVAYYSLEDDEAAVFGDASISSEFNGYKFYFASEENKELFEEKPWYFLPAWGGFCSWGISMEWWWKKGTLGPDADPNSWLITDDEVLHFFRSSTPKSKFMANINANIRKGNDVWKSWYDGEPTAVHDGAPLNTACFCDVSTCEDN